MKIASVAAALSLFVVGLNTPAHAAAATGTTLVAHRGGAPEHTALGMYKTYKAGVRYIELDVRLNKWDKPYIHHDAVLDRTTDCVGLSDTKSIPTLQDCGLMTLQTALYLVKKYEFTVYLHLKSADTDKRAKVVYDAVKAADLQNTWKVRYLGDTTSTLSFIDKYVPSNRLALMVSTPDEWSATAAELWYYSGPISPELVSAVKARGQKFSIVENVSGVLGLDTAAALGAEKYMINL